MPVVGKKCKNTMVIFSSSYEKMLEAARQRRAGLQSAPSNPQPSRAEPPRATQARVEPTPSPTVTQRKEVANDNGLPFSDDLYEHLKYVITKLSGKIKLDISLTPAELDQFEQSIETIIADAKRVSGPSTTPSPSLAPNSVSKTAPNAASRLSSGQSSLSNSNSISNKPNSVNTVKEKLKEENNPFANFAGLGSSWRIEGMENMTKEEYYEALNKRNAEIREARRREMSRPYNTDSYMSELSRTNKNNDGN